MEERALLDGALISLFLLGYVAILSESLIRVNKAASALLAAIACWFLFFFVRGKEAGISVLGEYLEEVAQLIFFIFGAMTIVELMNAHGGFDSITRLLSKISKRFLVSAIGCIAFLLSSVLDNLTTTIVMLSLVKTLISEGKERLTIGALVVIAANAGGSWTPIGDVTTTMLWLQEKVSSGALMRALFLPSVSALGVALLCLHRTVRGHVPVTPRQSVVRIEGAQYILGSGVIVLMSVPALKASYGIPPFLGIFLGVALLWILTDRMHGADKERQHLRIHSILTQVDTTGVLFFLGILLGVDALDAFGILHQLEDLFNALFSHVSMVALSIGFISAWVDNIPLVAAALGMYSEVPMDDPLWHLLSYCAGTGGSLLPIGSAAGIVFIQMEKVPFLWYLRRITPVACASYLVGVGVYFLGEFLL